MKINSQIYTDIDYTKEGKQLGQLDVPISTNTAGWANYYLPICVVKNGEGPTALIFGGNHGDEYEGPVTLMNLARWLQPEQVADKAVFEGSPLRVFFVFCFPRFDVAHAFGK